MTRMQPLQWRIGDVETRVYDSGPSSGKTVLFVHGGDPRSLANGLDWSTVWRPGDLRARLVAYDKPGQGHSYAPTLADAAMCAPALSAHLEGVVEATGAAPVVLVGHSRGALPVADVALRRPDLVAGLVLVSSNTLAPPSALTPTDFYPTAYADPPQEPSDSYVRREPTMNSWSVEHIDAAFVAGRREAALANGWWGDRARRAGINHRVTDSLVELRIRVLDQLAAEGFAMPVLQVWGQQDVSAPVELGHRLFTMIAARTAHCASLVLNGAANYVYRERPDEFTAALRGLLDRIG